MKRPPLAMAVLAVSLFAVSVPAAEPPPVTTRLIRFSSWSAEGDVTRDHLDSFKFSASATATHPAPSNGCEAVFLVEAAGAGRSVIGFDEDTFKLVSAQNSDGRDMLSGTVEWDVEALSPNRFRVKISPFAEPYFGLVKLHGQLVALISPSNVTESVTMEPRIGERARLDSCSLRLRPDAFAGALSFFGKGDDDEKDEDKTTEHLVLEVRASNSAIGEITISAAGKTILKKALGANALDNVDGEADLSKLTDTTSTMTFHSFSSSTDTIVSKSESASTIHTVRFEKPNSGSISVSYRHPATPERVPVEF